MLIKDSHIYSGMAWSLGEKWGGVESTEDSEICHSESSGKGQLVKISREILYIDPSSEEDDPWPTCSEEYTEENCRITTTCFHHFHLVCIYEWMESSDSCPFCGKDDCIKYASAINHGSIVMTNYLAT
ncbi:hypothetical protein ACH5RR_030913 [Cinchona calisaya]|uniref:RING-type E3 ubiquitin transferase n=1 Tax=Cinchona calisaya TaxID=153742 RepID=A0ABD2YW19_9GENT